jgi:hypothetical protein
MEVIYMGESNKDNKKEKFEVDLEKEGFKITINIYNTWTNANDDSTAGGTAAAQKGGEAAGHDQVSRGGELENTKAGDDLAQKGAEIENTKAGDDLAQKGGEINKGKNVAQRGGEID